MNAIKKIAKSAIGMSFEKCLTALPYFKNLKVILSYHRVVNPRPTGLHDPFLFVTPETLEMHIQEVSKYFELASLETIVEASHDNKRLCAITFDDGWSDNYDFAFAVLKKYRVPATIFIPVNMISTQASFWFQNLWNLAAQMNHNGQQRDFIAYFSGQVPAWRHEGVGYEHINALTYALKKMPASRLDSIVLQAYEQLGIKLPTARTIMNWDEIREMGQQGITFGSHGLHHNILTQLDAGAKYEEIVDSLRVLQTANVGMTPFFSYPNGNWDSATLSILKQAGYKGAVTTEFGINAPSTNPYLLKRIDMYEGISCTSSLLWYRVFEGLGYFEEPRRKEVAV